MSQKDNNFNQVTNPVDNKKRKKFKTWQKIVTVLILFVFLLTMRIFAPFGLFGNKSLINTNSGSDSDNNSTTSDITCVADLEGKKLGSLVGSACFEDAQRVAGSDGKVLGFNSISDLCQALQGNKIDAIVYDGPAATYASNTMGNSVVLDEYVSEIKYGVIFSKTDAKSQQLKKEFNEFLQKFKDEGKLQEVWDKWSSADEDIKYVDYSNITGDKGEIEIATSSIAGAPNSYMKNNEIVGADIDVVVQFCAYAGYKPVFKDMSFDSIIMSIVTNKYPLAVSSFTITEERAQSVDFSDPYYDGGCAVVVKGEQVQDSGNLFETIYAGFKKTFIDENRWEMFASGCWISLLISVLSILIGTILGFIIFFICHKFGNIFNKITDACIWLIKGMPVVVLLMILFYIVFGKSAIDGVTVSIVAFTLLFAAVTIGLLRTGLDAIDDGQREAGLAIGYTDGKTFTKIILPQAIRHVLPNFESEAIELLKGTAIVGYIAVQDLTKVGDIVRSATYDAIYPLLAVALLYFILEALIKVIVRLGDNVFYKHRRTDKAILKGINSIDVESNEGQLKIDEILHDVQKQVYNYVVNDDGDVGSDEEIIRFEHMKKSYDGKHEILTDVNASINKGDVVTLIGGSGCGKSTLIRCLNFLDPPTGGKIFVNGEEITQPGYDVVSIRKKVGTIFQRWNLFDHWTVIENVMRPLIDLQKIDKQKAYDMSFKTLTMLGLGSKVMNYPRELSGGQQQRVAIARTLVMQNDVVVLDEPTSALDPCSVSEVAVCLNYFAKHNKTLLIVTHDMSFARSVSNKIFFICDGTVYEEGSPEQILDNPQKHKTKFFIEQTISEDLRIDASEPDMFNSLSAISDFCMRNRISSEIEETMKKGFMGAFTYVFLPLINKGMNVQAKMLRSQANNKIYFAFKYSGQKQDLFADIKDRPVDKENFAKVNSGLEGYEYSYLEDEELPNLVVFTFKGKASK